LVDLWHKEEPWAAVTKYQDQVAHPFLLSREAVVSADEFEGEKVLGRLLVEADDDRVLRLSNVHRAPRDVNTPEDYDALIDESTNG
jgi:CTP:molybdopterin cytidylyltransferase MocA